MKISLIVAAADNYAIGLKGGMPWGHSMKADLKRFRDLTMGHTVIMGRKTWDSMRGVTNLPGRRVVVLSRNEPQRIDQCGEQKVLWINSLSFALEDAEEWGETECFVIGGAEIFRAAFPCADTIYATQVHYEPEADTFLPLEIAGNQDWQPDWDSLIHCFADENNPHNYSFGTINRIANKQEIGVG